MNDFEVLKNLLVKDRSIRRFYENEAIDEATLEKLVELTRYCGSGRNLQPLKYRIVVDEDEKRGIYPYLAWAGYYKDWDGWKKGRDLRHILCNAWTAGLQKIAFAMTDFNFRQ